MLTSQDVRNLETAFTAVEEDSPSGIFQGRSFETVLR